MPALTPYDTGDRLEPKIWLPYGTEVTPATPLGDFGKVDFDDDSGDTVCVVYVERTDGGTFDLHIEPLCDEPDLRVVLHGHKGVFELARGKTVRHEIVEPPTPFCPNTDHDGYPAPIERLVKAENEISIIEYRRCSYCAEGLVAQLLRQNWRVTIDVIA